MCIFSEKKQLLTFVYSTDLLQSVAVLIIFAALRLSGSHGSLDFYRLKNALGQMWLSSLLMLEKEKRPWRTPRTSAALHLAAFIVCVLVCVLGRRHVWKRHKAGFCLWKITSGLGIF